MRQLSETSFNLFIADRPCPLEDRAGLPFMGVMSVIAMFMGFTKCQPLTQCSAKSSKLRTQIGHAN